MLRKILRRAYYFDVVAALLALMLLWGLRESPAPSALVRDVVVVWVPLGALALLAAGRLRAYTQATPWIAGTGGALMMVAIAAIFWRWSVVAFFAAGLVAAILVLAGLVLRTRRLTEGLSRNDRFGLIAAIGSVLLTIVLAEGMFRAASGFFNEEIQQMLRGTDPDNYGVAHPSIGALHKPHNTFVLKGRDFRAVHHTDGLGFRNSWPWPERADIVAVGDSVTFGQGVQDDEAWPSVVATTLASRPTVNLGLIGAGPQQYLRVFETYGVPLRPRLLLVGFFTGNDFANAQHFDRWLKSGAGGNYMVWRAFGRRRPANINLRHPRQALETLFSSRVLPAVRRSYVYTVARALRGGVEAEPPPPPRIFRFDDGRTLQLLEKDFLSRVAAAQPGRPQFQLTLESLRQIQSVGTQAGARVLILLLPGKEEVYLPLLGPPTPDPTGALRAALDELGIEHLDLTPGFRARAAAGEQLFFEVDGHPNRAGQALIARLVHDHISRGAARFGLTE